MFSWLPSCVAVSTLYFVKYASAIRPPFRQASVRVLTAWPITFNCWRRVEGEQVFKYCLVSLSVITKSSCFCPSLVVIVLKEANLSPT